MKKAGFTLIEILMATAVLALTMTAVLVTLSTTFKNSRKVAAVGAVNSEGMAAMRSMENIIKYAKDVKCDLTLHKLDVVRLNNDSLYYQIGSSKIASHSSVTGVNYYLTSNNVTLSTCSDYASGEIFKCDTDNRYVNICFILGKSTSSDTSTTAQGSTGVEFRSQVTLRNWGL